MSRGLHVPVSDLIGGREQSFAGSAEVRLRLGETTVDGKMEVTGKVVGMVDAVRAIFEVSAPARLVCNRCLREWTETVSVEAEQYFRRIPDEDGYAIREDAVDVAAPARDELALALPAVSLCRPDCRGLCPTCGTDLNTEPCGGHGDDLDSPFAALKDLFDP